MPGMGEISMDRQSSQTTAGDDPFDFGGYQQVTPPIANKVSAEIKNPAINQTPVVNKPPPAYQAPVSYPEQRPKIKKPETTTVQGTYKAADNFGNDPWFEGSISPESEQKKKTPKLRGPGQGQKADIPAQLPSMTANDPWSNLSSLQPNKPIFSDLSSTPQSSLDPFDMPQTTMAWDYGTTQNTTYQNPLPSYTSQIGSNFGGGGLFGDNDPFA